MKLLLVLMIKNEERILERCLQSVEGIVDGYCICDTGSTDRSVEIANTFLSTRVGKVYQHEWKNFGHNRSLSSVSAQLLCKELDWNPAETYGLLLDADMKFVAGTLDKNVHLKATGYRIIQGNPSLEYYNCRFIRLDYPWRCVGVTHEYWDGPTEIMGKDICYIDDVGDGGSKADKFTRDVALLTKGLEDEPTNVRYMFYLAQSLKDLGRLDESIAMYKKSIRAGGWQEEVWYSHFVLTQLYMRKGDPIRAEKWALLGYKLHSQRNEALVFLAEHFRTVGAHFKAWYYLRLARNIPYPSSDVLFIDPRCYHEKLDYEETILQYYVSPIRRDGLSTSMKHLLRNSPYMADNVYNNLEFYVEPIKSTIIPVNVENPIGSDYHPSSISLLKHNGKLVGNVRFVNYHIYPDGGYAASYNGVLASHHAIHTENLYIELDSDLNIQTYRRIDPKSIGIPSMPDRRILGLEDVRIYPDESGNLRFTATSAEHGPHICIVAGGYDTHKFIDSKVMVSPFNTGCEKNWIAVPDTEDIIYSWGPLRVGKIEDNQLNIHTTHQTPWFFGHFRGSSIPFQRGNELWMIVHYVKYSTPRKYFHCMMVLDAITYKPIRVSIPFVFEKILIEYCLGALDFGDEIVCAVSNMDSKPTFHRIPTSNFQWVNI